MLKRKIKLIGYIAILGIVLFGYGAAFEVMVEYRSFLSISWFLVRFFALYKATMGIADCVFGILKEKAKAEDMKYVKKMDD